MWGLSGICQESFLYQICNHYFVINGAGAGLAVLLIFRACLWNGFSLGRLPLAQSPGSPALTSCACTSCFSSRLTPGDPCPWRTLVTDVCLCLRVSGPSSTP